MPLGHISFIAFVREKTTGSLVKAATPATWALLKFETATASHDEPNTTFAITIQANLALLKPEIARESPNATDTSVEATVTIPMTRQSTPDSKAHDKIRKNRPLGYKGRSIKPK